MSWGWNDPITEDTDWTALEFIRKFWGAARERTRQASLLLPAEGADIAFANGAAYPAPTTETGQFSLAHLQSIVVGALTSYVPKHLGPDYSGMTQLPLWTLPSLREYLDLPGTHFTRKYPRELNANATAYSDGSAIAEGHIILGPRGQARKRVSGVWVATAEPWDIITAYGLARAGDYIGPWIWNELRDTLNEMVWRREPLRGSNGQYKSSLNPGYFAVYADMQAAAAALYAAAPFINNDAGLWRWIQRYTAAATDGYGRYTGWIITSRGTVLLQATLPAEWTCDLDIYLRDDITHADQQSGPSYFDANGTPLIGNALARTHSFPETNPATWPGVPFGELVVPASWPYPPPSQFQQPASGYYVDLSQSWAVLKYDVEGGFQYTADT